MSMKIEEILQLLDAVSRSEITELDYKEGGTRLSLKKKSQTIQMLQETQPANETKRISADKNVEGRTETSSAEDEIKDGKQVVSPLVGTYYAAPAEDAEPYVKVGDYVEKGQVIAIVEAMKLMNEIESDFTGTVTQIYVENGQPVEYGQPLIAVKEV